MKHIKITSLVLFFALVVMVAQPYVLLAGKVVTVPGTVIVSSATTGVHLNVTSSKLKVGQSLQLVKTITYDEPTEVQPVKWASSNTKVATVSSSGKVVAKAKGTAKITVTTYDSFKASCTVTVTQPVTGVKLSKATATVLKGKTLKLTATVLPSTASNKKVTWKSSSTAIATVSTLGVVTGKKAGIATITVTTVDGKKTAKCKVTVK